MRNVIITREDLEFCCYAVMIKNKQLKDYAVALFYDLTEAERYVEKHYPIQTILNDEVFIAETKIPNEL